MKMDARRVKQKVSAGFKMRGLILRPYVTLALAVYVCSDGSPHAAYTVFQRVQPLWAVFRALDYLPKVTVVYFLRVRRGTSQHQSRDTNAMGC